MYKRQGLSGRIDVEVYNQAGRRVHREKFNLRAKSQRHLRMNDLLPDDQTGAVHIRKSSRITTLVKSAVYHVGSDGTVTDGYTMAGRPAMDGVVTYGYNTYLGFENWLRVFNTGTKKARLSVIVRDMKGKVIGTKALGCLLYTSRCV